MIPLMFFLQKVNAIEPGQPPRYQAQVVAAGVSYPCAPAATSPGEAARLLADALQASTGAAMQGEVLDATGRLVEGVYDRLVALEHWKLTMEGLEAALDPGDAETRQASTAATFDQAAEDLPPAPPLPSPTERRPVRVPELSREGDEPHVPRGGAFRPGRD